MKSTKIAIFYILLLFQYLEAQDNGHSNSVAEELYIKLFKRRRIEQLDAVKSLRRIKSYEQKYNMIILMAENVFTVIQRSRAQIEASGFIPGVSEFPTDSITKDALSNILENTALFAEVVLRLPDISTSVLKINNNWDILLQWSIAFTNQVNYLLDKSTIILLHLCSQELHHVERDEHFINPYRKANEDKAKRKVDGIKAEQKLKKKRKLLKKGPRLYNEL